MLADLKVLEDKLYTPDALATFLSVKPFSVRNIKSLKSSSNSTSPPRKKLGIVCVTSSRN